MKTDDIYNKPFEDAANTTPKVQYPLENIGTTNRPHYISVLDPFDKKKQITILASITVLMNLGASQRGLHMSRIERGLHDLSQVKGLTIEEYSKKLCNAVRIKQGKDTYKCKIYIKADYERHTDKNISGKPSHEVYELYSEHEINKLSHRIGKNQETFGIGLMVNTMNACPCAQRWGMRDFHEFLKSQNYSKNQIVKIIDAAPLQSHTNRGKVKIFIESHKISFVDMHDIIEKTSPIVRELLGANDEHAFIKEAHLKGLFCEDMARELTANTYAICKKKKINPQTRVSITVEMDESIHFHNVYCKIDTSLGELGKDMGR